MQQQFRQGQLIWHVGIKKKGKFMGYCRDLGFHSTVEFIVNYDETTKQRTTKLETVKTDDLRVYIDKKVEKKTPKKPLQLKVKYFNSEIDKLQKVNVGDWIDLRASQTVELKQGEYKLIPLGIGIKLPHGYEANIVPRSSTFKNFGVLQTNSFGVIDNSYSGNNDQYHFPALAMRDTVINKNERICQMRINRVMPELEIIEVEFLDEVSRGGFGSTGVK